MNPPAITHPAVDRLAALGTEELSLDQVAEVIGRNRQFVSNLIQRGVLEATKEDRSGGPRGGNRERPLYTITAAAVLAYLVSITTGGRVVLFQAIHKKFRHHLPLFMPAKQPAPEPEPEPEPPQPPAWLNPSRPRRAARHAPKPAADPFAGHPDLFGHSA